MNKTVAIKLTIFYMFFSSVQFLFDTFMDLVKSGSKTLTQTISPTAIKRPENLRLPVSSLHCQIVF